MNEVTPPVWALITGVIRDEVFLLSRLKFLYDLKQSGLIEQVVFSTWKDEISKSEQIFSAMRDYSFVLVESDEPDIICHGHYIHQMVALKNGLEFCPDNAFVLRTRTDKCGPESGVIEAEIESLLRNQNYIRICRENFGIFDCKIGTFGYHTTVSNHSPVLFFWHDRAYFGLKEDLQKFINFNALAFSYQNLIPEQAFFSTPFLQRWPILNIFLKHVNQKQVVEKIFFDRESPAEKTEDLIRFLVSNRLFRRAFLTERYILHKYFFDIASGSDIKFDSKYRDIEIYTEAEMNEITSYPNQCRIKSSDYKEEINSIKSYFKENFDIGFSEPEFLPGEFDRYLVKTPASNITIKIENIILTHDDNDETQITAT